MKAGTIVYNRSGAKAQYVAPVKGGHIVRPAMIGYGYGDEGEHEYFGDIVEWREVSTKEPTAVLHPEAQRLAREIDEKREELARLSAERLEFDRDILARKARLAQHEALARLDDFLTKGFTHLVEFDFYGNVRVVGVEDLADGDRWYDRHIRLVTLTGKLGDKGSSRAIEWAVNAYRDGSGGERAKCQPFCSEQEARAFAGKKLLEIVEAGEWRAANGYRAGQLLKSAKAIGIDLPAEVAEVSQAFAREEAQKKLASAQAALDKAKAALAAVESEVGK